MNIYAIFGVGLALAAALAIIFRSNLTKATVEGLKENYNIVKERCDLQEVQLHDLESKLEHCSHQHESAQKQITLLRDMVSGTSAVNEMREEFQRIFEEHDKMVAQGFRDIKGILRGRDV